MQQTQRCTQNCNKSKDINKLMMRQTQRTTTSTGFRTAKNFIRKKNVCLKGIKCVNCKSL